MSTETPDAKDRPVSDEEKALVGSWKKRIEASKKGTDKRFKQYAENRKYVRGEVHGDGESGLVRTNLILSTLQTLLPQTYAKDPDISVSPSEAVSPSEYAAVKKFSKTAEVVLQRKLLKEGKLKRRMKAAVRSAMTAEVGWLKVTYQKDAGDPQILNRINDIQDQLRSLEARLAAAQDGESPGDEDLKKAELEAELKGLRANAEVSVEKGMVIDKVLTEHLHILDPSVRDFDDYERAAALAQELWFDKDEYQARFGYKPSSKATTYTAGSDEQMQPSQAPDGACFYRVYEIWDGRTTTVYTWCEGEEGWCREPFHPSKRGRRWYPFFALGFNIIDGQFYPVADVQLLIELQDEYNRTRTNYAAHRANSLPIRVVREGGSLTPEDVKKIQGAKSMEVVVVSGAPGTPLQDELAVLQHPPIDPAVYDTTPIRADIEEVSGAGDAVRGSVMKAKTATEAEIMREGLMSRTAERQDTIEDVITWMAEDTLQVLLQELTADEVMQIAGPEAVWPALTKDQILDQVNLTVRAGSTGKPNRQREREAWVELMPVIENSIVKVAEFEGAGRSDLAEAQKELLREALNRFDERIDADSLFGPPGQNNGAGQMAAQAQQAMMQNQQLQQAVQQLQEQLMQAQQALQSAEQQKVAKDNEIAAKREIAGQEQATTAQVKRYEVDRSVEAQVEVARAQAEAKAQAEIAAQQEETRRELMRQATAYLMAQKEDGEEEDDGEAVIQAVEGMGEVIGRAMQEVAGAMDRLAKVTAAPQLPERGQDGRISRVVRQIEPQS